MLKDGDVVVGLVKDGKIIKMAEYGDRPELAPSHEDLARMINALVERGVLQPGVEAFTVWKEAGKLLIRGSNNFNVDVSPETRALLEKSFQ